MPSLQSGTLVSEDKDVHKDSIMGVHWNADGSGFTTTSTDYRMAFWVSCRSCFMGWYADLASPEFFRREYLQHPDESDSYLRLCYHAGPEAHGRRLRRARCHK